MKINEIFTSLSGEADGFNNQGGLATFVRCQGCNLDCVWCDTKDARNSSGGTEMAVDDVVAQCSSKHIIITGGEPLLQKGEVKLLMTTLVRQGHHVTIETNGSAPLDKYRIPTNDLRLVVDYKLSSSGVCHLMQLGNFNRLFSFDVIKFVLADLQDYRQAKRLMQENPQWRAKKVFSPMTTASGGMEWPSHLARTMIEDELESVTLSLQWHKLLDLK